LLTAAKQSFYAGYPVMSIFVAMRGLTLQQNQLFLCYYKDEASSRWGIMWATVAMLVSWWVVIVGFSYFVFCILMVFSTVKWQIKHIIAWKKRVILLTYTNVRAVSNTSKELQLQDLEVEDDDHSYRRKQYRKIRTTRKLGCPDVAVVKECIFSRLLRLRKTQKHGKHLCLNWCVLRLHMIWKRLMFSIYS